MSNPNQPADVSSSRISIQEYGMLLAVTASLRSEDPKRKVGAVGFDSENRVIATAYNGLPRGLSFPKAWWESDENRRTYVVHAEANLCSLTHRGQLHTAIVTTIPCGPCALNLVAHGVKRVVYGVDYPRDTTGRDILVNSGIELVQVDPYEALKKFNFSYLE